jgi:hypothetical protein
MTTESRANTPGLGDAGDADTAVGGEGSVPAEVLDGWNIPGAHPAMIAATAKRNS